MTRVVSYHRPNSLPDALKLLRRAGIDTRVLAGGTMLNAGFQDGIASPVEVVDLQALSLNGIDVVSDPSGPNTNTIRVGAMTTLNDVMKSTKVPVLIRELARTEGPSTLRNMATVGGTIGVGNRESALLAGLLACRATVVLASIDSSQTLPLAALVSTPELLRSSIVTDVVLEVPDAGAWEAVRRTPADAPIVTVAGARFNDSLSLGISGGDKPFAHDGIIPTLTVGDFRGSASYREQMIRTLITRVSEVLNPTTPASNGASR